MEKLLPFFLVAATVVHTKEITLSFSVIGQPNLGVGFKDVDPMDPAQCPVRLGVLTKADGTISNVDLTCEGNAFTLTYNGQKKTFTDNEPSSWTYNAMGSENVGSTFNPAQGLLVDVMYDTAFDGGDALQGRFTVSTQNKFLMSKYDWTTGAGGTLGTTIAKNTALKAKGGTCPVLSAMHKRVDDFPGGEKLHGGYLKRYNYLKYYAGHYLRGIVSPVIDMIEKVPNSTKKLRLGPDGWRPVLGAYRRGEQTDLSMLENAKDETFDQMERYRHRMQCLAPVFPSQRGQLWQEDAIATIGHYDKVAQYMHATTNKGIRLLSRQVFDSTLPPMSGFKKPDINDLAGIWKFAEPTIYDIASVTFHHSISWWSGKAPHKDDTDTFARYTFPAGHTTPNVNVSRANYLSPNFQHAIEAGAGRLAKHLMGSPVWEIMSPALQALNDQVSREDFLGSYAPILTLASIGNIAAPAETIIKRFRTDVASRALYRKHPRKFLHEWLRVKGGAQPVYALTDKPQQYNVTYDDLKDGMKTKTTTLHVSNYLHQRLDPVTANTDPSMFSAPNTFKPEREDWMHGLSVAAVPLWVYYKTDPSGTKNDTLEKDAQGEFTYAPDYQKPHDLKLKNWCSGYWMGMEVFEDVVTFFLDQIERTEQAGVCVDRDRELVERFSTKPKLAPEATTDCMYAAARIDVRFGVGEGCKRLGGDLCCATCSTLDQKSPEYMHVLRSVFFIMAKEDQFTWLTPYTFEYFLHTQKYFDEDSEVRVPAVSGIKKVYKGAEAILEYYTLQGYNFNPRSYRHYAALYETSDDEYISEPDGLRMRQLHLDPQVNLGVQSDDIWAKWPDFSHAVFDNTTAFMPFRLLFHDFRQLDNRVAFRTQNRALLNSFGTAWQFCQMMQERCTGENRQFDSLHDCVDYMQTIPNNKMGWCPTFAGNTLSCRWMHSILAQDGLRPDLHCFHMGRHRPDPTGNIKCDDSECGHESQGEWKCGPKGCEGELLHAGTVIDAIHCTFWFLAFVWACVMRWGIGHREDKMHDKESLLSLYKAKAIVKVFALVAAINFFVWIVCVVAKPAFLYRPPGIETLEPRFLQLVKPQSRVKGYSHAAEDYDGSHSESFFSYMNSIILQNLMDRLLWIGVASVAMIVEWLGHHYYIDHGQNHGVMTTEAPQLGHAVFVLFVTIAFLAPMGVMTLIVFILGLTKFGYPEVMMTCWAAHGVPADPPKDMKLKLGHHDHHSAHKHKKKIKFKNEDHTPEHHDWTTTAYRYAQHWAATGLMLHHFTMVNVIIASFLSTSGGHSKYLVHIEHVDSAIAFNIGLVGVLYLVLVQHVIFQLVLSVPIRCALLGVVEIIFQWFAMANIGETNINILSTSILTLCMSHWMMFPIILIKLLDTLHPSVKVQVGHKGKWDEGYDHHDEPASHDDLEESLASTLPAKTA